MFTSRNCNSVKITTRAMASNSKTCSTCPSIEHSLPLDEDCLLRDNPSRRVGRYTQMLSRCRFRGRWLDGRMIGCSDSTSPCDGCPSVDSRMPSHAKPVIVQKRAQLHRSNTCESTFNAPIRQNHSRFTSTRARVRIPGSARCDPGTSRPLSQSRHFACKARDDARRRYWYRCPRALGRRSDAVDCGAPSDGRARAGARSTRGTGRGPGCWMERAYACACVPTAPRLRPPANVVRERCTDSTGVRSSHWNWDRVRAQPAQRWRLGRRWTHSVSALRRRGQRSITACKRLNRRACRADCLRGGVSNSARRRRPWLRALRR
jgi:hypothetical protein